MKDIALRYLRLAGLTSCFMLLALIAKTQDEGIVFHLSKPCDSVALYPEKDTLIVVRATGVPLRITKGDTGPGTVRFDFIMRPCSGFKVDMASNNCGSTEIKDSVLSLFIPDFGCENSTLHLFSNKKLVREKKFVIIYKADTTVFSTATTPCNCNADMTKFNLGRLPLNENETIKRGSLKKMGLPGGFINSNIPVTIYSSGDSLCFNPLSCNIQFKYEQNGKNITVNKNLTTSDRSILKTLCLETKGWIPVTFTIRYQRNYGYCEGDWWARKGGIRIPVKLVNGKKIMLQIQAKARVKVYTKKIHMMLK